LIDENERKRGTKKERRKEGEKERGYSLMSEVFPL